MAIPTDFSVTTARVSPIANPGAPIVKPKVTDAEQAAGVSSPSVKDAESSPSMPAPGVLTANAPDPTMPPFALNHARILYENKFSRANAYATSNIGAGDDFALVPNTFLSWGFDADNEDAELTIISSIEGIDIDTIAIGGHTISDVCNRVIIGIAKTGSVSVFDTVYDEPVTSNKAIMWHSSETFSVKRIKITLVGADGPGKIGVVYAGIALQMQRPFFSGHTPITENRNVRYYDAWSESGNLIARSRRAVSLEASYSWNNLNDTWYRTYFQPFRDSAEELPFFIAWNLLEYPGDVGLCLATNFDTAYSGTRSLRTASFDARGAV